MHALLALSLIAQLHSPAHTPPGHHYGWQHPRNPHHITNPWRGSPPPPDRL